MAAWKLAMKFVQADAAAVRLVLKMNAAWLVPGSERHGAENKTTMKRKMRAAAAGALDRQVREGLTVKVQSFLLFWIK